jgi:hypothetical protein
VDVDQVLAGGLLVGRVAALGIGGRAGRAGRLVPRGLGAGARAVGRRDDGERPSAVTARRGGGRGGRGPRATGVDELAHAWRDLLPERLDVVCRADRQDERVEAVLERELGQALLAPCTR